MFILQLNTMKSLVKKWIRNLEINNDDSIFVDPAQNIENYSTC